ncbi:MAG: hypothetical protein COW01_15690 [Bdellovibrionales bacterium CG12_big_fil_rev_8_21_14_0_65_38_15]|nr:MAG: hypothetical protein COW79_14855 [Bdellovibrionales bacterium CG22_combo_CG10-13_8_21_14_all_38_13]PIQ52411.1 MAG: hypothetical protein COW01_15690 [Bdellovibrionales bacterium CG12_big_fil_rev_8_21_14_0_65_38_15]PIR29449.1 MAG: hypothetical protein COV38_10230 [Bdellovibrionales bacterium CG11_big_fil_rev_8_21_14_0_20_38_13]
MNKEADFTYTFKTKLWKYQGPAGWYFVTVPKQLSKNIRKIHQSSEEGWGRLKSNAVIAKTSWRTAIWFDTKADAYLLPIKAEIRKKESLQEGSKVEITLSIEFEKWFWDKMTK